MQSGIQELEDLRAEALAAIRAASAAVELEQLQSRYLGRRGVLTAYLRQLGTLPAVERPLLGGKANQVKEELRQALTARRRELERLQVERRLARERIDVTLPGRGMAPGRAHPVSATLDRIVALFASMGFAVVSGPEIEDEYHNFEALNMPANHPARTMHDTFFLRDGNLLRTHTSSVQVRVMRERAPPFRVVAPGRVYRRDQDMTHSPMFHQVEGLMVDERIGFSDLKGLLFEFLRHFFGRAPKLRFRPSYFPFTEPSAEVDLRHEGDWLEILGCGMVHPRVLEHAGIDSERYLGLAFGMGVERLAMLRHGIEDLRLFFENDLRFLEQFG